MNELESLKAANDRLRRVAESWERGQDYWFAEARRAEAKLAAANALLERAVFELARQDVTASAACRMDIRAHLAGQPATAPDDVCIACVRTAAEQAVLDACESATFHKWEGADAIGSGGLGRIIAAELARRSLK